VTQYVFNLFAGFVFNGNVNILALPIFEGILPPGFNLKAHGCSQVLSNLFPDSLFVIHTCSTHGGVPPVTETNSLFSLTNAKHTEFKVRFQHGGGSLFGGDFYHIDYVRVRGKPVTAIRRMGRLTNVISAPSEDPAPQLAENLLFTDEVDLNDMFINFDVDTGVSPSLFIAGVTKSTGSGDGLGVGCLNLTPDVGFAARIDLNNLSCDWATEMVTLGSKNPTVEGVTAGRNGEVFITGTFFDDVGVNAGGTGDQLTIYANPGCELMSPGGGTSNQDVFVAGLDGLTGGPLWLTGGKDYDETDRIPGRAGGPECDTARDIATDRIGNLYITGLFQGQATFGDADLVSAVGGTDIYVANLTLDGEFFEISGWTVGVPIPPPDGAVLDNAFVLPEFYINGVLTDLIGQQVFYYAPPIGGNDAVLYPLASIQTVEIRWRISSDLTNPARVIQQGATLWPSEACGPTLTEGCFQVHVAGAPVELEPEDGSHSLFLRVTPQSGGSNDNPQNPQDPFTPTRTGFTSLLYVQGPQPDPLQFPAVVEIVRTLPYASIPQFQNEVPWEIGQGIVDPYHNQPFTTGHVVNELSPYDGEGADASYQRETRGGSIIPVNRLVRTRPQDIFRDLVVAWYHSNSKNVYWPDKAVSYRPFWPLDPDKIIIASQQGVENLGQQALDPAIFQAMQIYHQPDPAKPGFNPNDEHAIFAPSNTGTGLQSIFALRSDFGSNLPGDDNAASDPYVLLKYFDPVDGVSKFRVFEVQGTGAGFDEFRFSGVAANPVFPPYPLSLLPGCEDTQFIDPGSGQLLAVNQPPPPPFFKDYKNQVYAKSAGSGEVSYTYPLQPGFFYDIDNDDVADPGFPDGTCVNWLPRLPASQGGTDNPNASILVGYDISWPDNVPILVVGETLLDPKFGLPAIRLQAGVEVVFDELQDLATNPPPTQRLTQLIDPLNPRFVFLDSLPDSLATELDEQGRRIITGNSSGTIKLPVSIRDRLRFDSLNGRLSVHGIFDKEFGIEPLLLLNVLSKRDRVTLKKLDGGNGTEENNFTDTCGGAVTCTWDQAIEQLFRLSRNPHGIQKVCVSSRLADGIRICDSSRSVTANDVLNGVVDVDNDGILEPFSAVGVQAALTAGFAQGSGFLTLAFNNDPTLTPNPVSLEVIRVDCLRSPLPPEPAEILSTYQGSIHVLAPDNVFDEQLVLRHSGDFGGNPDGLEFRWFFIPAEGVGPPDRLPDPEAGQLNGWISFPVDDPLGANEISIEGANIRTLSDNWYLSQYRGLPLCNNQSEYSLFAGNPAASPRNPSPQLAEGWVKRVLKRLNPFEARVQNFAQAATNNTVSMLAQLGTRFEGSVPLNSNPENLNSLGLIEAYTTILNRAMSLSVDATPSVNYGPANDAILLVASRLVEFYTLLGNEAFADSQDPTIGITTGISSGFDSLAPTIFTFQNQLSSVLEEELTLMRGRDDSQGLVQGSPVYNRLFWNFTTGEGEVAYAISYNIADIAGGGGAPDGIIDEKDARAQYPQGHGDAWGHYLTALDVYYDLLKHPFFSLLPRGENILVAGAPIGVDFQDERQFAETAAAKAKTGTEIVDLTYRQNYVADPRGQFQGYRDMDEDRAWGVAEWGARAGRGAYFDWVTGNSLIKDVETDPSLTGIQRIDRQTVEELIAITSSFQDIQAQVDEADGGLNPLGLAAGVVPFDIDPSQIDAGVTHFEQVLARAETSLANAVSVWDFANTLSRMLRFNQNEVEDLARDSRASEVDFKNRLIEIFGYPYPDDIGPGGTYPANYDGPDLYHYMLVDRPLLEGSPFDINACNEGDTTCDPQDPVSLLPAKLTRFTGRYSPSAAGFDYFQVIGESESFGCTINVFNPGCALGEPNLCPRDSNGQVIDPNCDQSEPGNDALLSVEYTMMESDLAGFGFTIDPEWTSQRRATGRLQDELSEMLQARVSMERAFREYENLRRDIEDQVDTMKATFDIRQDQISIANTSRLTQLTLTAVSEGLKAAGFVVRTVGKAMDKGFDSASECVPKAIVVGLSNGGDTFSGVRCAMKAGGTSAAAVADSIGDGLDVAASIASSAKEDVGALAGIKSQVRDNRLELFGLKGDLDKMLRQEPLLRAEIYQRAETIGQLNDKYLATLAEGQRLQQSLISFRKGGAAAIQEFRYKDLAFRIFRNDALQKYRAAFDTAARYTFLAASAYDYETNLLGSNAQAGQNFLSGIIRERSIGQILDGSPVPGSRGLADPMARMKLNFEVLKGQMGFNNPQVETNRFSIRKELLRIPDTPEGDLAWREILRDSLVSNLFEIPEFQRFARPFAPESAGPQPGIVIRFPTNVSFGLNYFGNQLEAGDSAYDSSNFATKVRGVGVWFQDFAGLPLSETPRVYLFPTGADVLRAPAADNFQTREWSVIDQVIPVPFPIGSQDLDRIDWIPSVDTVIGSSAEIRRFSRFRAHHFSEPFSPSEIISDSRLIGRSVWNREWMLIIPGESLLFDPNEALDIFIDGDLIPGTVERDGNGVSDIKLFFQTYAYSGN
jgi:hypothetical protein